MHAIVVEQYGDPSALTWKEWPEPTPGPDQVAIRVSMTSVNFVDTNVRAGRTGAKLPLVPGVDCAGTIVAVGANVKDFKVGQRVAAFSDGGSYAEVVLARAVLTFAIPDGASDESACAMVVLVTAWNVLTLAGRIVAGDNVLVHAGAGGVGSVAIQLAKMFGAKKVIATVGNLAKAEYAREAGADLVLETANFASGVRDATEGRGADLILDAEAGPVFAQSLEALAPFGRLVVYGLSSKTPGSVLSTQLHPVNRAVIGYSSGYYRAERPALLRPAGEGALRAIADKKVKVTVSKTFALRDAAEAHRFIESRKSHGKILLKP